MVMHRIISDQRVVFPLMLPMNTATGMPHVDGGGPGLSFWSLVDPIGQQLTNMTEAAATIHVR